MLKGHFYFIKDSFYKALPDCNLMANKENDIGKGKRPCHYCFIHKGLYWMVPISSKVEKYHQIYKKKVAKRGYCDTICFGYVNGVERAFLIQNCFPVTEKFIDQEYRVNKDTVAVTVSEGTSKEINAVVRKVIRLYNRGIKITFTDIDKIIKFISDDNDNQPKD